MEDFTYDALRSLNQPLKTNFNALDKCIEMFNDSILSLFPGKKITFFTTGSLAREYPELVKELSDKGHEIASHYNYHDLMYLQDSKTIESNLVLAKEYIFKACGKEALGFRAPAFSISQNNFETYRLISKHFKYDSSYVIHELSESKYSNLIKQNPLFNGEIPLYELPIISKRYCGFNIKSGGSFFRLFPEYLISKVMNESCNFGFNPMIYLHPYDYLSNKEFMLHLDHYKQIPFLQRYIRYLRQLQWLGMGNKSTIKKLQMISDSYNSLGRIKDQLKVA